MSKVEHKLGLTPVLKRLAFYFLKRGLGTHECDHAPYDKVIVRELYGWTSPGADQPAQGGIAVEFHQNGKRIRWVEFAVRDVGGGGEPIVREL